MARFEAVHIYIFIVFFILNVVYLVECDDKRIIIYVPRRIKTVHHHHHHVVLMDPKSKTATHARPYAEKSTSSSAEDFQHRERARDHQHQYARQQHQHHHQQQQQTVIGYPVSFTEQRKAVGPGAPPQPSSSAPAAGGDHENVNLLLYQAAPLPLVHVPVAYTTWPARKKRSKVIARLYTY